MKIDLSKIDQENFLVHDHFINGQLVHLVQPNHIGTKFTQENKIFRSSVWDHEGNLVSAGLPKFTNFGENPEHFPVPASLDGSHIVEKIDGCCDQNTIIITDNGPKTIKEICETKYMGTVLGYNHITDQEEMSQIVSHSIQPNIDTWYELEMENGNVIRLTGNHLVFLPELQCYRRVDELKGNEIVHLKK